MELNALLRRAVELGASDVHLKVGRPPMLRRDGALAQLDGYEPLTSTELALALNQLTNASPAKLEAFNEAGDLDLAYQEEDLPRFRVNAFRQRGEISFAFRVIPKTVPTFADLNLPPGVAGSPRSTAASSSSPARPARERRPPSRP